MKNITKTIKNKTKKQISRHLNMLSSTLGSYLYENMLAKKGTNGAIWASDRVIWVRQDFCYILILWLNLILPKILKNGVYVINIDEYTSVKTQWIALYVNSNELTYFSSL